MFTTDRLILRAYRESDMPDLLLMADDPELLRFTSDNYIVPRSAKFEATIRGWVDSLFFAVIEDKDNHFLGTVTLSMPRGPKNREALLAITLTPSSQGKGYGTEAMEFVINHGFKALALHRITLYVFDFNTRAIALYKKLGFVDEGRLRKALWHEGGWVDVLLMGMLEEDWEARHK